MSKRCAILLFGPTASGKTAMAIKLAQKLNATIINADSRQVYTDLPILTAMPTADEFAAAPHKLFSFKSPIEPFSAGDYRDLASQAAEEVWAEGKTPMFVGGTGFYLKALEDGLAAIPPIPEHVTAHLRERLEEEGRDTLLAELEEKDPAWASSIEEADTQRLLRGLAVLEATGRTFSDWQKEPNSGALEAGFFKIGLAPPRDVAVARINKRFDKMMAEGLLAEIDAFCEKYDVTKLPSQTIHGLRELVAYKSGEMTLEHAAERITAQIRQYAKRQMTWMNNTYKADIRVASHTEIEPILSALKTA